MKKSDETQYLLKSKLNGLRLLSAIKSGKGSRVFTSLAHFQNKYGIKARYKKSTT